MLGTWPSPRLHVPDLDALPQGRDGIGALWNKLLRDESFVTRFEDRLHHRWIMDLLGIINLRAPRDAAGVVMRDVTVVFSNGVHHIPLHDLHVVNIIKQLEALGANPLHQVHAPRR